MLNRVRKVVSVLIKKDRINMDNVDRIVVKVRVCRVLILFFIMGWLWVWVIMELMWWLIIWFMVVVVVMVNVIFREFRINIFRGIMLGVDRNIFMMVVSISNIIICGLVSL